MFRWVRLAASPEGDGFLPYANEHGVWHGRGTPLLEKDKAGCWRARPREELALVLAAGYGGAIDLDRRMDILESAARALNRGDRAQAAISLVHADFPPLPDADAATRMAQMDLLLKFSPNEARLPRGERGAGQWTRGDQAEEERQRPKYQEIAGRRGCAKEWAEARTFCNNLKTNGLLGSDQYRGFGLNFDQCLSGMVSARCGGNPIR